MTGTAAGIAGTVATLVVNSDGTYTYTQYAPVVNAAGTPGNTEETSSFIFNYTVKDGDDDTSTGSLTIKINDDTPLAKTVTETTVLDDDYQAFGNDLPAPGDGVVTSVGCAAGDMVTEGQALAVVETADD